ncbi:MAG: hypothetical protein JWM59_525, partial [Verrucomicrobiales bacterium]|nr:hypothetical protein [Verrucomicrobiales bacterium]
SRESRSLPEITAQPGHNRAGLLSFGDAAYSSWASVLETPEGIPPPRAACRARVHECAPGTGSRNTASPSLHAAHEYRNFGVWMGYGVLAPVSAGWAMARRRHGVSAAGVERGMNIPHKSFFGLCGSEWARLRPITGRHACRVLLVSAGGSRLAPLARPFPNRLKKDY